VTTPGQKLAQQRYYAKPEKRRIRQSSKYLRLYGITLYDAGCMLARQGGRCGICRTDAPGHRGWHVDHDHATGKVRGILCTLCNIALGGFRDSTENLTNAIAYLKNASEI
jgi:hypothetical protein